MQDLDIYDVDRQAECQKGNYLVGNDQEGYRFAVHNIVDESYPLYQNESDAMFGLYEYLLTINAELSLLPTYQQSTWD